MERFSCGQEEDMKQTRSFIGMDVHKATISISVAEDGRTGPVRFLGLISNTEEDVAKMAKRLSKHGELDTCYEASGCGYGIHRQLTALGHRCSVVAPSLIPRKAGEGSRLTGVIQPAGRACEAALIGNCCERRKLR
jgi:hypothetical protein